MHGDKRFFLLVTLSIVGNHSTLKLDNIDYTPQKDKEDALVSASVFLKIE